jgi:hypothetical protein
VEIGVDRVRLLVASLDRPIKEIDKGSIALPVLIEKLCAEASLPGADKDLSKRVVIVVSVAPPQPVVAREPEPVEIRFATRIVGSRLGSVLGQICSKLDAVVMVRDDFIEIVYRVDALAEFGLKIPD